LTLLAAALLPVALALAGSLLSRHLASDGDGALHRVTLYILTGAVGFHLWVTLLDLAGIPWSPVILAAPFVPLLGLAILRRQAALGGGTRLPSDLGWGDGTALFALAIFSLLALTAWIATPDFIYHWGVKGHRFQLARGVDYDYLALGWNWALHPDYPNLLPELFAATALFGGGFDAPAMMLWSVVFFALMLGSARQALREQSRFTRQAGLALVALAAAMFGIGHLAAGAADWMLALALMAAVPALLRPPVPAGDLQIGIAAAFAAASKIEGIPLAAFLVLIQLARRALAARRMDPWAAARLVLPAAAVVLPWVYQAFRHGLIQPFTSGGFQLSRAGKIFPALLESLAVPSWHGLTLAALLLPPLLALHRRTRPLAAVVTLQLLFFLYAYFTAPVDTGYYVISSFPRLLLQVIPALLVAGVAAFEAEKGNGPPAEGPFSSQR
jgi:hypothetical protein